MNRRNFIETGLTAGVAAASTGIPQAQGKKSGRLTLPQPRKIAHEVFGAGGYDAIWYLVNVGFVVRLGEVCIFLDPILQSGNPLNMPSCDGSASAGGPAAAGGSVLRSREPLPGNRTLPALRLRREAGRLRPRDPRPHRPLRAPVGQGSFPPQSQDSGSAVLPRHVD